MLELKNIYHYYSSYGTKNDVLSSINVIFQKGSINTIFGNSGTGKSTLLNIAGLINNPKIGDVLLGGKKVNSEGDMSSLRLKYFGYIFQDHYQNTQTLLNEVFR